MTEIQALLAPVDADGAEPFLRVLEAGGWRISLGPEPGAPTRPTCVFWSRALAGDPALSATALAVQAAELGVVIALEAEPPPLAPDAPRLSPPAEAVIDGSAGATDPALAALTARLQALGAPPAAHRGADSSTRLALIAAGALALAAGVVIVARRAF